MAWQLIATPPVVELVAWLAVELLHLVRIGSRCRLICGTWLSCWRATLTASFAARVSTGAPWIWLIHGMPRQVLSQRPAAY